MTDYAQLKKDAQIRNGTYIAEESAAEDNQLSNNQDHTNKNNSDQYRHTSYHDYQQTEQQTGDTNPDHGYEADGDVKMASEQHSAKERINQTNFNQSHPRAEALSHRTRDAEAMLNHRMSDNHRTQPSKWEDGLRRDDSDESERK